MMDEIHRPVRAARAARLPPVAPVAAPAPAAPPAATVRSRAVNESAPDSATVRPPPSSAGGRAPMDEPPEAHTDSTRQVSWESLESLTKPAPAAEPARASAPREGPVHERNTSPPPPSTRSPKELDAEVTAPQSSRDELLAAFLADAPIDGSVPPPGATAPPPASADVPTSPPPASVETALPKGGPKRAEKVTVKRDK